MFSYVIVSSCWIGAEYDVAYEATQVNLFFIANNASHKFEEIGTDSNVNVSFYDESTTSWASFTGTAKITQDQALIKKFWSSSCVIFPHRKFELLTG